jgi:two-component sensor histidine kinase
MVGGGMADVHCLGVAERDLGAALDAAETLLMERERQLIEMNHRIANVLQITSSFLKMQRDRTAAEEAKDALGAAMARILAAAQFHQHLYRRASEGKIDLQQFLGELAPEIDESMGMECSMQIEPVLVRGNMAVNLATLITELILNARKHAYAGQDGGAVTVTCRRDGDGRLRLTVSDHGGGLPADFNPRRTTGLGMKVVGSIVQQLKGEMRTENDGGARFTILVPLA